MDREPATRPLRDLTLAAEAIASGDYARRVPVTQLDDIGRLARAFNTMATRLEGVAALEDRLRKAQRMEAVGQVAGAVAHDFNNLLSAIIGYTELLRQEVDPADRRRADLDEVAKAARRAAALTKQLLAFSRTQALQPSRIDLNAVLTDMHGLLSQLIGDRIEVAVHLEDRLWPVVADANQFEQIVVNLAVNARDAMPEGGQLTIATSNLTIPDAVALRDGATHPGAYVTLTVTDTGCGMDEETRRRVFEPFFTTKCRDAGTGLGLATVYGIVRQSGGYVRVESARGKGAAFTILLPRAPEDKIAPSLAAAPAAAVAV